MEIKQTVIARMERELGMKDNGYRLYRRAFYKMGEMVYQESSMREWGLRS